MKEKVLKSGIAGTWYTDNPDNLRHEVDLYLDAVDSVVRDSVIGLLLPHAGYRYSGMVAAHAVKQIVGRSYSRVVVMGPSHRTALTDTVSIPDADAVETPLGRIEIDRELAEQLWGDPCFESHPQIHGQEHSVQILLPFLQRALDGFKVLPMVCGQLGEASARHVAAKLLECIDQETLVVVSSDFTHYGRSFDYVPFREDVEENLRSLDMGIYGRIENRDLCGFLEYVRDTGATICGRSPIAVLLAMLPEDAKVQLMKYDTSGNLTGDWAHCVSYASAAVTGKWAIPAAVGMHCAPEPELSESDKDGLIRLARNVIAKKIKTGVPGIEQEITPPMRSVMGAFVTLRKQGRLRGCIGEIFPRRALCEAVAEQALNAAFHDPRFPRLREDELGEIEIEISALSAPRRVGAPGDIEIGKHGIVLCKGMRSAVFLPQVAPEQGWNLEETLSRLAMKAGLAADGWKDGCEFHVFEANVFGGRDLG